MCVSGLCACVGKTDEGHWICSCGPLGRYIYLIDRIVTVERFEAKICSRSSRAPFGMHKRTPAGHYRDVVRSKARTNANTHAQADKIDGYVEQCNNGLAERRPDRR